MKCTLTHGALVFVAAFTISAAAQTQATRPNGPAAFLFAYSPKTDQESRFGEGYRRHLAWHRNAHDPLLWYGWYVTAGERIGTFIDGTFGISFAAFDKRVEPKADGADFEQNVAPFATPLWRAVYRLRSDLSTAQPLETQKPSALAEVTHVAVEPGTEREFEKVLEAVRMELLSAKPPIAFTCYQLVAGLQQSSYLLMVSRSGWADYDTASPLPDVIDRTWSGRSARIVQRMATETWSYRPDLSQLPE